MAGIILKTQAEKQQNNDGAPTAHMRLRAPSAFCCDSRKDSTQQRLRNCDEIRGSLLRAHVKWDSLHVDLWAVHVFNVKSVSSYMTN